MSKAFINREKELNLLKSFKNKTGLLVFYGRRRVGKTHLLRHWLAKVNGIYAQAIEAQASLQIAQLVLDLKEQITFPAEPKNWQEFFQLLETHQKKLILCIDEFPYLVASSASLPSILQAWLEKKKKQNILLILNGSSQSMMYETFLDASAPLYGRALNCVSITPMSFDHFCEWRGIKNKDLESFTLFSLVGGIPRYWELLEQRHIKPVEAAKSLYFGYAPYMDQEPRRLLKDERINGLIAWSVCEAIGRGAHKPSEIASRIGVTQTQLSKTLRMLLDCHFIQRHIPFGEQEKNSKRSLYQIDDPAMRFWFYIFSPLQSRWENLGEMKKKDYLHRHASMVFENHCRNSFPGAQRYWEPEIEIDIVHKNSERLLVGEVKFKKLSKREREDTLKRLKIQWGKSKIAKKFGTPEFKVFDIGFLG